MSQETLASIEKEFLKESKLDFKPGDTVRVHVQIKEGEKTRIQAYEGIVTRIRGAGLQATFTVRRISYRVAMERIFPVHSPVIQKIDVVQRGRVRRSKLYYLRDRVGKAAKVKPARYTGTKKKGARKAKA